MAKSYKPDEYTVCIECRQPIGGEEYIWTKMRGYPPAFIHKGCYDRLLPKKEQPTCKMIGK